MSVSHEQIMAEILAMKAAMATKDDLAAIEQKVAGIETKQTETKELVELLAFVKTGSRAVAWLAKLTAGLLLVYIFLQGGAQFLVELGTRPPAISGDSQ